MDGNFSNRGVDTFDPTNNYLGLRLQQGVPLLDRDWNELNDIRLHLHRMLQQLYIGDGVPDTNGFGVMAVGSGMNEDVLIGAGHCLVDGYDVANPRVIAFSEQGDRITLPAASVVTLYLLPEINRVGALEEPALANDQDIGIETCLRDRLNWAVEAVVAPSLPPPNAYPLAEIRRSDPTTRIGPDQIVDLRRTGLRLSDTVDGLAAARSENQQLAAELAAALDRLDDMQADLDRIFWQVSVSPSRRSAVFGGRVSIEIQVTDRRGNPIQGAHIGMSTDWGTVSVVSSITDANGRVTAELVGVNSEVGVRPSDIAQLDEVATMVEGSMVRGVGINRIDDDIAPIQYTNLYFTPVQVELVSRYSPQAAVADLTNGLPRRPEVALPSTRTATVNVYVKESPFDSIVKASGNVQIRFGEWVRPWLQTKLWHIIDDSNVTARIGDLIRQGIIAGSGVLDTAHVVGTLMPGAFSEITYDTTRRMKAELFGDEGLADTELRGAGRIGALLAEEATNAVGAKAQQAIQLQVATLVQTEAIPAEMAVVTEQQLASGSSQIVAGAAQLQKQRFATVEV